MGKQSERRGMNRHFRREGWIMFIVVVELTLLIAVHFFGTKLKLRRYLPLVAEPSQPHNISPAPACVENRHRRRRGGSTFIAAGALL